MGGADGAQALKARLDALADGATVNRLFYLALRPDLFGPTTRALQRLPSNDRPANL